MENYYEGDLSDIVRAGTATSSSSSSSDHHWQFSSDDPNPIINFSAVMEEPIRGNIFGDPFANMRDPFLHHHPPPPPPPHHPYDDQLQNIPAASNFSYMDTTNNSAEIFITATTSATTTTSGGMEEAAGFVTGGNSAVLEHKIILQDDMRRPCHNMFSNLIQISPNAKLPTSPGDSPAPVAIKPPDASKDSGLLISPSRNPGLKRRKSQVKKVVCIPAPEAANSRSSGEVVPSDLWAWRKYGQKPIKGSPYPRGYYRCSSSKGCLARKQVERSRTDPKMLVITYTSEHNHPWPTQRNALAGSTRSHASKSNNNKNSETTVELALKQQKIVVAENSAKRCASVKQETEEGMLMIEKKMDDGDQFFAELGELIEADHDYPLDLFFSQGFHNDAADHVHVHVHDHDQHTDSKALDDPFHDLF